MNTRIFLPTLVIAILCVLVASCRPSAPTAVIANFTTGVFSYNCTPGSPLLLAFNGTNDAKVSAQITSVDAPQFDSGLLVYGSNSQAISFTTFTNGCAAITVPVEGAYVSVVRLTEGDANCNPGSRGPCWRWFTIQTLPSGFIPNCGNSLLFINQMAPDGFVGPCI